MDSVFFQILGYVIAAFALGLFVGFLSWRLGRASIPGELWTDHRRELERVRGELEAALVALRAREARVGQAETDIGRMRHALGESSRQRDDLQREVVDLRDVASNYTREMNSVLLQVQYLQRRLAELRAAGPRRAVEPVA